MTIFSDSKPTRVWKHKFRGRRRSRTKQPKRTRVVRYFRDEGPAQGLKLSYDPKDPQFPFKWILSKDDLILQVTKKEPKELWEKLTTLHKEANSLEFQPTPETEQEMRRRLDDEEIRRLNFWEKVASMGRKKHSHPILQVPYPVQVKHGVLFREELPKELR